MLKYYQKIKQTPAPPSAFPGPDVVQSSCGHLKEGSYITHWGMGIIPQCASYNVKYFYIFTKLQ